MDETTVTTTVAMPRELLDAVDRAVACGAAASREDFLFTALRTQLSICECAEVDAAFDEMASDPHYRQEAVKICEGCDEAQLRALLSADP